MSDKKISIVSAYTKSDGVILQFLERMLETMPQNAELVLVNNGSDNISHPAITKLVTHLEQLPYCKSFNSGLKEADGDYIIQISNDIFPEDDHWVTRMVESLEDTSHSLVSALIRDDHREYLNHKNFKEGTVVKQYVGTSLPSHCWIISKDDLLFYDESFTGFHSEDDDYCMQLKANGQSIGVMKGLIVEHRHKVKDTGGLSLKVDIEYNRKLFNDKWGL